MNIALNFFVKNPTITKAFNYCYKCNYLKRYILDFISINEYNLQTSLSNATMQLINHYYTHE